MGVFIGLLLFIICATVGLIKKSNYANRQNFFANLVSLINFIKIEIEFKKTNLEKLIFKAKFKFNENRAMLSLVENFESYIKQNDKLKKPNIIKEDEWQSIKNCLENLGTSAQKNEIELCEQTLNYIKTYEKTAKEENLQKGTACIKLWLCFGLLLFIVFI